jgi:capsular exopolysaccharide synthesis family protein
VTLAFVLEAIDSGYRSADEIERDLGLSVLAHIPKVRKAGRDGPASLILQKPETVFAEAIRSLYVRMLVSHSDQVPLSITFVSSEPDEGKTTIALSLARFLAKSGQRVLLVDADLHCSPLAKLLHLDATSGLAEVLAGEVAVEDVVRSDPQSGAKVLLAGNQSKGSAQFLDLQKFSEVMLSVERRYTYVIVDSPPITAVSDADLLVSATAMAVLVVAWGSTNRELVRYSSERMKTAAKTVSGVVLSKVDLRKSGQYGYGDSLLYSGKTRAYYAKR